MADQQNTRLISLTQGKFAIVDTEDFEWLNQWKWCHGKGYPMRRQTMGRDQNNKRIRKSIWMHRLIMNAENGQFVDHKDGNPLNNSKNNLRICTKQQNQMNQHKRVDQPNKYKGIWYFEKYNKYTASIHINYKKIYLGYFDTEVSAAQAYNEKAKELFGEFAHLNIIVEASAAH